ncbi:MULTISPECIES: VTT domain-containing protein [unclassified Arthrobacter]|uniref:DedA family protein n=1 Tax=unclassified Arthrobacter TaxID=235627 RepID=UPI001E419362|nr:MULTISPECIES: VTT domain-containing protein [unclassified Arthrobacter]MCC9144765.1 VTT domain-containing protein [Arthrobacter sp. zg-Y919]MDK1275991.1 VTT domain-containing protein [Arthrobacter sp. zg.Y919]WIB02661.1 VTT domain-containing protein [Arthrobacter sp. zg-Y919]
MTYPSEVTLSAATAVAGPVRPPTSSLLPHWLDPQVFLADPALGPWVVLLVCGIVFAETGLLVGFFLPGDSLLFTAGLLVATGTIDINVWLLGVLVFICAFAGDQTGYFIGKKAGPAVFNRPDSRLFKRENVKRAQVFFDRHGGKAVVLARFVPVVRTFTPVVAGVAQMEYKAFVGFNALGAFVWGVGVTLLGYVLGDRVPFVRENLDLIFVAVVVLSVIPIVVEVIRQSHKAITDDESKDDAAEETQPRRSAGNTAAGNTVSGNPAPGNTVSGHTASGKTQAEGAGAAE